MRRRGVRAGVLAAAMAALAGPARAETVMVDCAAGGRIQDALGSPAAELVVEVRGTCSENVLIERSNVTLRGADATVDGVRAPAGSTIAAVTVRDVHDVRFESLTLAGGTEGLSVRGASDAVFVKRCTLTENHRVGLSLDGGKVFVSEATITHNVGGGVFAVRGLVNCYTCTIVDNRDPVGTGGSRGVYVGDAVFTMLDSTISGSRTALELEMHATAEVEQSTLTGTNNGLVSYDSDAALYRSSLGGGITAFGGQVRLLAVTQLYAAAGNQISRGAYADFAALGTTKTKLVGFTRFDRFSRGVASSAELGTLQCTAGADVWCDAATTAIAASCGLCRRP